jgi:hypothetical protein
VRSRCWVLGRHCRMPARRQPAPRRPAGASLPSGRGQTLGKRAFSLRQVETARRTTLTTTKARASCSRAPCRRSSIGGIGRKSAAVCKNCSVSRIVRSRSASRAGTRCRSKRSCRVLTACQGLSRQRVRLVTHTRHRPKRNEQRSDERLARSRESARESFARREGRGRGKSSDASFCPAVRHPADIPRSCHRRSSQGRPAPQAMSDERTKCAAKRGIRGEYWSGVGWGRP